MTKIKRSFLERLTGAKTIETNVYETERMTQPTINYYDESENKETEMFVNQQAPESMLQEKEENYSATSDDSEGQLTIDVYQTDNDIVIKSTIAGVKPEDLDVSINNDMLTIRGERKNDEQVPEENYYYQECYWGTFSRSVILPVDVVAEKIEASMKNGILTVRMPKADSNRTKKIQVRGF
jgi:HSP20 family protein